MNNLRQKSWYYAATLTAIGVIGATVLVVVATILDKTNELVLLNIEAASYIVGATLAVSIAGVSLFDWIPTKIKARMQWLMNQPLARQAAIWFLVSILVLSVVKLVRINILTVWTASLDIALNAVFTLFGILVLYRLIGVLFTSKK